MTRDELVAHCKRKIEQCERWAAIKGEEIPSDKVYDEHRFVLTLLTQPREHEISLADAIIFAEQGHSQAHEYLEKIVSQKPFISKSCVSEQKVLEKIKAELADMEKAFESLHDYPKSDTLKYALSVIDKHMAESEEA